jgi:hypothetical protein
LTGGLNPDYDFPGSLRAFRRVRSFARRMPNYDFTTSLSPIDFELLSKDLLEAELQLSLENFREGKDRGIDLRYAPSTLPNSGGLQYSPLVPKPKSKLIVQCKRYTSFSSLKSELRKSELPKIQLLNPERYILTTSASLSPQQADEVKELLDPFVTSTGDIFGRERLNSLIEKHPEIERRHIKLWVHSAGVLNSFLNPGTHIVSREEAERTIKAATIYVRNTSFDEALRILKLHRVCIISGMPGIGKTTLARMLLLYFYERRFDIVKIESDISEARAIGYHNRPRFYYYDDFLGQTSLADKLNKNEDQKLLDFIKSVRESKDSVLVLTTREYILNQARLNYEKLDREKFDHRTCVIDLSKYSRRIRAQILYNHLHFSDLPRGHLTALIASRGYLQIVDHPNYNPRLIEYLTSTEWVGDTPSENYLDLFLSKLNNPSDLWDHVFRNQLSNPARNMLFVLTTLPTEVLLKDLENAFDNFHAQQCRTYGIPRGPIDFKRALKELEGTFATTRKVQEHILVRFANPSIRDFMQNLLLLEDILFDSLVQSSVFFEQPKWFSENFEGGVDYSRAIAECLDRLAEGPSCSMSVAGTGDSLRIRFHEANLPSRIADFAAVAKQIDEPQFRDRILFRIDQLAEKIAADDLAPAECLAALKPLQTLGYLSTEPGTRFVTAVKSAAMTELRDLDDFKALAGVVEALREAFSRADLRQIEEAYSSFVEKYVEKCDLDDPEEIREEASRIGEVGDVLGVNTDREQERLHESAQKIEEEKEESRDWDPDDDRGGAGSTEICPDSELDSMFGTLT